LNLERSSEYPTFEMMKKNISKIIRKIPLIITDIDGVLIND
jgi:hypothetical protein